MPFSLRAKRKRRSNLSDRCTLDNKSTTSVRRGANLSRSDTHCHPRRLGSSATSLRQPETSAQVFFPQHSNILHWSNILKPKFSWLRFQKFTFPIPIGVTSLARGLACLLQLTVNKKYRQFITVSHITVSRITISRITISHTYGLPPAVTSFSYQHIPLGGRSSFGRHTAVGMSVYLANFGGRKIHARLASGWESAVGIPLGCESCCGSPRILLKFGVLQPAKASRILWLIQNRKMADQGEEEPR